MTAPSLLPKRGRGRQSAAAEAQYQKQVAAFCKLILQIRSSMDSADQRSVRVGPAEGKETTRRCARRDSPGIQNGHFPSARSHPTSVCSFLIFVLSSLIRLSVPISRGTVTGQRNSRTRLRASCPTSRTSEHSRAGARRCDVRMFGCLSLNGPHREGGLLAGLRTYLPLSRQP